MLHYRLFNDDANITTLYKSEGKEICGIQTLSEVAEEKVLICSPEEIPDGVPVQVAEVKEQYPHPFLPFDLMAAQNLLEEQLKLTDPATRPTSCLGAIYWGANPFDVYRGVYLAKVKLGARLAGIKSVLEIGSGLSIIGHVVTQLMPHLDRVSGIEIDPNLRIIAARLTKFLERRLGYDVSRLRLHQGDIFSTTEIGIGDFDAVAGWFPLGLNITNDQMIVLFRGIKKGAMVFQMYDGCPLPSGRDNSDLGFGSIAIDTPHLVPISFFERI